MAQKRCFGCMQLKENSPVCEHCGFNEYAQNESHQLPLGTVLRQQYMVGKALGQGGFGITYLGWDLNLDIPIAIKEYYPNSIVNRDTAQSLMLTGVATNMADLYISTRQRFLREAKVLAMLRNVPNIVQVHNFFEENNTAYIIMEYVKGIDLRRYMNLRGGRLSVDETLTILKPVMEALQRVHEFEIVHRDISPDNIMMMPDGTAKLLDFGAVRNVENADTEKELQHSTEAILKHGFAPMEQYQKRGALGPWTDEYALCATIYYCLTGRVPPDAPQRMMEDVHPAWEKIPGLTAHQIQVLKKGMALRAKDRYASIRELMAALYASVPAPTPVFEPEPIAVTKPVSEPVYTQPMVTKPVAPIAPGPEPEEPLYTAPMVTKPLDTPDEVLQRKKPVGLIAVLALVAALAAGAWMLGGKDDPQMHATETEAPVISTEAPETTAPPVTTTEAPEIDSDAWRANVLMEQDLIGDDAFDTPISSTNIQSITFRNTLKDAPEVNCWDVSEAQDGSVMAWVYQNGDKYDMYIAAEGGINAKYCESMFSDFLNLERIDFGNGFHTDEATSMASMFKNCQNLHELDISGFNTALVTDMSLMFNHCFSLETVNVEYLDMSNVTSTYGMFSMHMYQQDSDGIFSSAPVRSSALKSLDVSNWDMSNVTNMYGMFSDCAALENLDVSNWDVSKVTSMNSTFRNCGLLRNLDVRNWDISNVQDYKAFAPDGALIDGITVWELFNS